MTKTRFAFTALVFALLMGAQTGGLHAQPITIVSGNGQLICTFCTAFQPMIVRVTNAAGVPQAGVTVNWSITGGSSTGTLLGGENTTTDAGGQTSNTFFVSVLAPGSATQPVAQTTITARTPESSTAFTLSKALQVVDPSGQPVQPVIVTAGAFLQELFAGTTLSGASGTSGSTPIQLRIGSFSGIPLPSVSMQLVSLSSPSSGPIVNCQENQGGTNMVLSDANGFATCTPLFGGVPASGQFYILLGQGGAPLPDPTVPPINPIFISSNIRLSVTPGAATAIRVVSGNNQSANPGQTPAPFVAEVLGASNQPVAGQQVQWSVSPAGAVNFANAATTTDASGRASNTGTLSGSASGAITITATVAGTSFSTNFTLTAVPPVTITGFTIFSGNNQSAPVNTAFAQPLVVQVTVSAGSPAGITVQFQSTGSISLSATTATTDANGRAQVNVTAGSVTGPASVTASVASSTGVGTQTFSLNVSPPAPTITAANFVNGADYQANSLSPCSVGAIVTPAGVLGIPNVNPTFPGRPIQSSVSLTINNVGAPIQSISNTPTGQQQIVFQVPCETPPGSAVPATVSIGGGTSPVSLSIQAASPGIFQNIGSDNVLRAVVVRPDGSFATTASPARRGENVSIYVTGLGTTLPAVGTGSVPPPGTPANVQGTVIMGMAGGGVPVVSTRLTQDLPGVALLTFSIPSDAPTGNDVLISVALIPTGASNAIFSAGTTIPIQ